MSTASVTVATPAGPVTVPAHVRLVEPLPGLPGSTEYRLDPLDELGFLFALRGEDAPSRRLFVISPAPVFPDYAPRVPRPTLELVGGPAAEPAFVLLAVVHPAPDEHTAPTADLLAPIVVDVATGTAIQTVLDDDLPLRAPLG